MSENPTRRQFSAEFKRDAVDLTSEQPGRTSTDVAHQLGIRPALLQRWRREARARGELAFLSWQVALSEEQQQIRQLQKQLCEAEMDREILRPWPFSVRHPESLSLREGDTVSARTLNATRLLGVSLGGDYQCASGNRRSALSRNKSRSRRLPSPCVSMAARESVITAELREQAEFAQLSRTRVAREMQTQELALSAENGQKTRTHPE